MVKAAWEVERREEKHEIRNAKSLNKHSLRGKTIFDFRFSIFDFRFSIFDFPLPLPVLILLMPGHLHRFQLGFVGGVRVARKAG